MLSSLPLSSPLWTVWLWLVHSPASVGTSLWDPQALDSGSQTWLPVGTIQGSFMKYPCLGRTHKDSDLLHLGHSLGNSFKSSQGDFFFSFINAHRYLTFWRDSLFPEINFFPYEKDIKFKWKWKSMGKCHLLQSLYTFSEMDLKGGHVM